MSVLCRRLAVTVPPARTPMAPTTVCALVAMRDGTVSSTLTTVLHVSNTELVNLRIQYCDSVKQILQNFNTYILFKYRFKPPLTQIEFGLN